MASNVTNISHGQANWDTAINQNFKNLDADSGYISLPLLAPFTGEVFIRKNAHSYQITGTIKSTEALSTITGTPIANIPANIAQSVKSVYFISLTDGANGLARMVASGSTISILSATTDITEMPVRFTQTITF